LAALPAAQARDCIAQLKAAGYSGAAVIGVVAARSEALEPIIIDLSPQFEVRNAELAGSGVPSDFARRIA
jgi:hypothetical protein